MWVNRLGVAWCALRGAGRGRWVWAVPGEGLGAGVGVGVGVDGVWVGMSARVGRSAGLGV